MAVFDLLKSAKLEITFLSIKNVLWNQLFSKIVAFTKFWQKEWERISLLSTLCYTVWKLISRKIWVALKILKFSHCGKPEIHFHLKTNSWKHPNLVIRRWFDEKYFKILREINFRDSRSANQAILTHSEALNSDFYVFLHFLKALKSQHMAVLELLDSPKLILRKNLSDRTILKFLHSGMLTFLLFGFRIIWYWMFLEAQWSSLSNFEISWLPLQNFGMSLTFHFADCTNQIRATKLQGVSIPKFWRGSHQIQELDKEDCWDL